MNEECGMTKTGIGLGVIPVKTGIQILKVVDRIWTPAFAGVTDF